MYWITNISASDLAGICPGNKNLAPGASVVIAAVSLHLRSLGEAKIIKIAPVLDQPRKPVIASRPAEPPLATKSDDRPTEKVTKKSKPLWGGN